VNHKILILGRGYIAGRLSQAWGCPLEGKKIFSFKDAEAIYKKHAPRVIVNCIGHVGKRNVDDCELDADATLTANTLVPVWLGEIAFRRPVKLVHISSGCIYHYDYGKQRPITELLVPDYYNLFYSRTKIYAEGILEPLSRRCNILIARIRVPLDKTPHPRNILTKLIQYKTIIDVPNSITYIPDFIKMLEYLLKIDARGIYNCTNKGALRYPMLMDVYKKYVPDFKYTILPLRKLGLDRTNLVLSVRKLEKSGFKVRPIKDVLEECVRGYVQ
jgi:dTDP-4-dehydrorhamnose reductase